MIKQLMIYSPIQFLSKRNSSLILWILTLFASAYAAEPAREVQESKQLICQTNFGKWLWCNRNALAKYQALLQNPATDYTTEKEIDAQMIIPDLASQKLTTAGLLYLMELPLEIQQHIAQYLISHLSPTTVGVRETDLSSNQSSNYAHNAIPVLHHSYRNNQDELICPNDCKKQSVPTVCYGWFKNSNLGYIPPNIRPLWNLMSTVACRDNKPDPVLMLVYPFDKKQRIIIGYDEKADDTRLSESLVEQWEITPDCHNKRLLQEPMKHNFDLNMILGLLDAENSLQARKLPPQKSIILTQYSINRLNEIKTVLSKRKRTTDDPICEPIFIDPQLAPSRVPIRRQRARIWQTNPINPNQHSQQ